MSVDQIGVGMASSEVGRRNAILGAAAGKAKLLFEDCDAVGAGDTIESVKEDLEVFAGGKEFLDEGKVEYVFEHLNVIACGIDDFHFDGAIGSGAYGGHVDIGDIGYFVFGERFRSSKDLAGDGLWCGCSIGEVIFHAKVLVWPCKQSSAIGATWMCALSLPPGL